MDRSGAHRVQGGSQSPRVAEKTSPRELQSSRHHPVAATKPAVPGLSETVSGRGELVAGRKATGDRPEEILDGAAEMFADHGYYGSSVRDIGKHIGLSHSGMLHHFESKDALLDGVIERLEAHAQEALDRVHELCVGRDELLSGLVELWHPASLRIQLLAVLEAESVCEDHPGRFRLARLRRVHEHTLETCFAAFAERGQLREGIDPDFAGRALLATVLNLAVRERTVRPLQTGFHDDAPITELGRQIDTFIAE